MKKEEKKKDGSLHQKIDTLSLKIDEKKRICLSCHTFSVEVTFSVKKWFISHL
jgi:hypothetical protein